MGDQRGRRVENVRLVRLPDGRLVPQEQADKLQIPSPKPSPETVPQTQSSDAKRAQQHKSRLDKKVQKRADKEAKKHKQKKDILEVWEAQKEIKKESERLEIEYQVAKKITKDLKRKIKEKNQPYEGEEIDEAFKDLLSPDVKNVASKLKPHVATVKTTLKDTTKSGLLSVKKLGKFTVIVVKKASKDRVFAAKLAVCLVLFVGLSAVLIKVTSRPPKVSIQDVKGDSSHQKIPLNQTPEFPVLTPAGKKVEELGGFARVSPEGSAAAYAFTDKITDIPIKVSQQQLPEAFKTNPSEMENLSKQYYANTLIQVDTTAVYVGTSDKGPQTAIFTKEGLLVFIVADREVPDIEWVRYVTNLIVI